MSAGTEPPTRIEIRSPHWQDASLTASTLGHPDLTPACRLTVSDTSKPEFALSKLPSGGDILVGRESEFAQLDEALASDSTHVNSFVAWGGTGSPLAGRR